MSTPRLANLLSKNHTYVQTSHTAPRPIAEGLAKRKAAGGTGTVILSCTDPRITPENFFNLDFAEAAIIRNGGGRTRDALRTILALDALGAVGTIVVVHHTDCGMSLTDEADFLRRTQLRHPDVVAGTPEMFFGAIDDPERTVIEDVEYLKSFESLKENMDIVGLVLDTFSGELRQVI